MYSIYRYKALPPLGVFVVDVPEDVTACAGYY